MSEEDLERATEMMDPEVFAVIFREDALDIDHLERLLPKAKKNGRKSQNRRCPNVCADNHAV